MKPFLLAAVIVIVIMVPSSPKTAHPQEIKLIVRGDDFGMTQGSVIAFEKAFNEGILTCGSLLVQPPWFEAAASLARKNPRWCIGIHLSLEGEWRGYINNRPRRDMECDS
jgi:YdjC-like protein